MSMSALHRRISSFLRQLECRQFVSKAVVGTGVGLSLIVAARTPGHSRVSCDTSIREHENLCAALRNYLASESCQRAIEREVAKRIKPATDAAWYEIEKQAKAEVEQALARMVPQHVQHAKSEVQEQVKNADFSRQVNAGNEEANKTAKEVSDRLWWDIQKWVEAEVNKRIAADVQKFLASDANIQRVVGDHIAMVRAEISTTAEQVLREVAEEDRYQKTNNAVLAELRRRSDELFDQNNRKSSEIVERTDRDIENAKKKIEMAVDERVEQGIDKAMKNARMSQLMGLVASLAVAAVLYPQLKK